MSDKQENKNNLDPLENLSSQKDNESQASENKEANSGEKKVESITDLIDTTTSSDNSEPTFATNTVFDINISNFNDLVKYTVKNDFDFFIIEPAEDKVKISFRKDKLEKEVKYIKYPVYSQILLKAKSITKLVLEDTQNEQEGKAKIQFGGVNYNLYSKTVATNLGEKLFFKIEKTKEDSSAKKTKKKASLATVFGFLGAILFTALVMGGSFITFVVLNAKTIDDVAFFNSLGINLNDINSFIETTVGIIFSIVLFIEVILLVIFLFKFFLTKKQYRKKKITKGIISALLLLITFSTLSAWMFIDRKIQELPNWLELSYGDVKMYDNAKLLSENFFDEQSAIMTSTTNLIGPVTIKYDLTNFLNKEKKEGFNVKKFLWDFKDGEIKETIVPEYIKTFDQKGTYSLEIKVIEEDIHGKEIEKAIDGIQAVEISHLVDIEEKILDNGGKEVSFDASDLKELGKIKWYYIDKKNKNEELKSSYTGYKFFPKLIFEETLIGIYIKRDGKENDGLDKIFIISPEKENTIKGEILSQANPVDDLEYSFKVKNPDTDFGYGLIKEFIWTIDDKVINKKADPSDVEGSSEVIYNFKKYGEHKIQVEMIDSSGNKKTLKETIKIIKNLKLKSNIKFYNNGELLGKPDVRYEQKTNEYFLKDLQIPTDLLVDASDVESDNFLYSLKSIEWDIDGDGKTDKTGNKLKYRIDTGGDREIIVKYSFKNRKIKDEIVYLEEKIYISAEKKEVILSLDMKYNSDYAPVVVAFDASKSQIKGKDISKFIFDYGDGTPPEQRDAINPGHKYLKAGDYNVKLTVITTDGDKYDITKKLVLKPEDQKAKIKASLKKVPTYQGIDFSSSESSGQITNYFWDFGDGEVSTEANPTHMYTKPGTYKVKLNVDFKNQNTLSDEIEIEVTN